MPKSTKHCHKKIYIYIIHLVFRCTHLIVNHSGYICFLTFFFSSIFCLAAESHIWLDNIPLDLSICFGYCLFGTTKQPHFWKPKIENDENNDNLALLATLISSIFLKVYSQSVTPKVDRPLLRKDLAKNPRKYHGKHWWCHRFGNILHIHSPPAPSKKAENAENASESKHIKNGLVLNTLHKASPIGYECAEGSKSVSCFKRLDKQPTTIPSIQLKNQSLFPSIFRPKVLTYNIFSFRKAFDAPYHIRPSSSVNYQTFNIEQPRI